ncbi:unnamed protein product [Orchesella dallaii]|uniref:Uncharacterized protein n=1 Tax=Orchesella dallaii TaxID=48710 RepID=A0ABP1S9A3_9HEXA
MSPSFVGKHSLFPILLCWSSFLAFIGVVVFIIAPLLLPETNWTFFGVISAVFLAAPILAVVVKYLFAYLQKFVETRNKSIGCLPSVAISTVNLDTKLTSDQKETKLSKIISLDGTPPDYVLPSEYNES